MEIAARLARGADRILNLVVSLALILVLLFGGYALWDSYLIYNGTSVNGELLKYKPTLDGGSGPGLSELIEINGDVRAWLTLDDTHVDYPVVQGTDNVKYVNTDVYGEYSLSGSIFLDHNCAGDFSDHYSLLYGHHMDGGAMFGELEEYLDGEYFNTHKTGTLYLPDKTYDIRIFACLSVDAFDKLVFDPTSIHDGKSAELLEHIRALAVNYRELELGAEDKIIGLSTCSDNATNGRTVVFGQLLEKNYEKQGGDKAS